MARPRLHFVDEHFFDQIDSEAKAYWLGFLYADGHPAKHALMLGLAPVDSWHVERFRAALGSQHKIRYLDACTCVAISSRYLSARVRQLRDAVKIPRRHAHHFWRGVFDGDGCIHRTSHGYALVSIAGSKPLVTKLAAAAGDAGIERGYVRKHDKPQTKTWVLHITTVAGACAFRDWIYRDATVFLERKKILFSDLAVVPNRACIRCGAMFSPRYRAKGDYCSRKCYMQDYYAANRETKWKENGAWKH